jgi:tRNA threonylcarbamoyladenosine biosynthesis protein TsaE
MNSLLSDSPERTRALGAELAVTLSAGSVLSLVGDLSAGKTEFVKGLAIGLECALDVTSPTFTLVHEYRGGRLPLFHMDLYRLLLEGELDDFGFDEYLMGPGVCAIEWADKFPERLPADTCIIRFTIGEGDTRMIEL